MKVRIIKDQIERERERQKIEKCDKKERERDFKTLQ